MAGFGSFSRRYGLAAANLLEAEVVTADGTVRIVNAIQEPDLFWALKGGGGGTFGVVTRLTLRTHDLPTSFGFVRWSVRAGSDDAFRTLLGRFAGLCAERLVNVHWGEQVCMRPGNRLDVTMLFQDLDEATGRATWQPLTDFVAAHADEYRQADTFVAATHTGPAHVGRALLPRTPPRGGYLADSDDCGQAFQLKPSSDSNPRRTGFPTIPSTVVIGVAMQSGGGLGVKHERLGGSLSERLSL